MAPPPISPLPAVTAVMSPPAPDDTASHTTVPFWFTPVISWPVGQALWMRCCTCPGSMSWAPIAPSTTFSEVTLLSGMPFTGAGRGLPRPLPTG